MFDNNELVALNLVILQLRLEVQHMLLELLAHLTQLAISYSNWEMRVGVIHN